MADPARIHDDEAPWSKVALSIRSALVSRDAQKRTPDEPVNVVDALFAIARSIVDATNRIERALQQQTEALRSS